MGLQHLLLKIWRQNRIIISIIIFSFLVITNQAYALNSLEGLNQTAQKGYFNKNITTEITADSGLMVNIPKTVGSVIGTILSLLGVAFMSLIIYGGFIWMFARGNDQAVVKAKGIIETAIIGLVIVLSAYSITVFVSGGLGQ